MLSVVVTNPATCVVTFSSGGMGGAGGLFGLSGWSGLHAENKTAADRRKNNTYLMSKVWRDVKMVKIIDMEKAEPNDQNQVSIAKKCDGWTCIESRK